MRSSDQLCFNCEPLKWPHQIMLCLLKQNHVQTCYSAEFSSSVLEFLHFIESICIFKAYSAIIPIKLPIYFKLQTLFFEGTCLNSHVASAQFISIFRYELKMLADAFTIYALLIRFAKFSEDQNIKLDRAEFLPQVFALCVKQSMLVSRSEQSLPAISIWTRIR